MSMSSMQPSCRRTRRSNGRIGSSPRLPAIRREWSRWMARCWTSHIFAQLRKFWRHATGSQDLGSISAPSAIHPGFEHELDEIVALRKEVGDAQLDRVRCCWIDGCEEGAVTSARRTAPIFPLPEISCCSKWLRTNEFVRQAWLG